jgi:hypothetical protein
MPWFKREPRWKKAVESWTSMTPFALKHYRGALASGALPTKSQPLHESLLQGNLPVLQYLVTCDQLAAALEKSGFGDLSSLGGAYLALLADRVCDFMYFLRWDALDGKHALSSGEFLQECPQSTGLHPDDLQRTLDAAALLHDSWQTPERYRKDGAGQIMAKAGVTSYYHEGKAVLPSHVEFYAYGVVVASQTLDLLQTITAGRYPAHHWCDWLVEGVVTPQVAELRMKSIRDAEQQLGLTHS